MNCDINPSEKYCNDHNENVECNRIIPSNHAATSFKSTEFCKIENKATLEKKIDKKAEITAVVCPSTIETVGINSVQTKENNENTAKNFVLCGSNISNMTKDVKRQNIAGYSLVSNSVSSNENQALPLQCEFPGSILLLQSNTSSPAIVNGFNPVIKNIQVIDNNTTPTRKPGNKPLVLHLSGAPLCYGCTPTLESSDPGCQPNRPYFSVCSEPGGLEQRTLGVASVPQGTFDLTPTTDTLSHTHKHIKTKQNTINKQDLRCSLEPLVFSGYQAYSAQLVGDKQQPRVVLCSRPIISQVNTPKLRAIAPKGCPLNCTTKSPSKLSQVAKQLIVNKTITKVVPLLPKRKIDSQTSDNSLQNKRTKFMDNTVSVNEITKNKELVKLRSPLKNCMNSLNNIMEDNKVCSVDDSVMFKGDKSVEVKSIDVFVSSPITSNYSNSLVESASKNGPTVYVPAAANNIQNNDYNNENCSVMNFTTLQNTSVEMPPITSSVLAVTDITPVTKHISNISSCGSVPDVVSSTELLHLPDLKTKSLAVVDITPASGHDVSSIELLLSPDVKSKNLTFVDVTSTSGHNVSSTELLHLPDNKSKSCTFLNKNENKSASDDIALNSNLDSVGSNHLCSDVSVSNSNNCSYSITALCKPSSKGPLCCATISSLIQNNYTTSTISTNSSLPKPTLSFPVNTRSLPMSYSCSSLAISANKTETHLNTSTVTTNSHQHTLVATMESQHHSSEPIKIDNSNKQAPILITESNLCNEILSATPVTTPINNFSNMDNAALKDGSSPLMKAAQNKILNADKLQKQSIASTYSIPVSLLCNETKYQKCPSHRSNTLVDKSVKVSTVLNSSNFTAQSLLPQEPVTLLCTSALKFNAVAQSTVTTSCSDSISPVKAVSIGVSNAASMLEISGANLTIPKMVASTASIDYHRMALAPTSIAPLTSSWSSVEPLPPIIELPSRPFLILSSAPTLSTTNSGSVSHSAPSQSTKLFTITTSSYSKPAPETLPINTTTAPSVDFVNQNHLMDMSKTEKVSQFTSSNNNITNIPNSTIITSSKLNHAVQHFSSTASIIATTDVPKLGNSLSSSAPLSLSVTSTLNTIPCPNTVISTAPSLHNLTSTKTSSSSSLLSTSKASINSSESSLQTMASNKKMLTNTTTSTSIGAPSVNWFSTTSSSSLFNPAMLTTIADIVNLTSTSSVALPAIHSKNNVLSTSVTNTHTIIENSHSTPIISSAISSKTTANAAITELAANSIVSNSNYCITTPTSYYKGCNFSSGSNFGSAVSFLSTSENFTNSVYSMLQTDTSSIIPPPSSLSFNYSSSAAPVDSKDYYKNGSIADSPRKYPNLLPHRQSYSSLNTSKEFNKPLHQASTSSSIYSSMLNPNNSFNFLNPSNSGLGCNVRPTHSVSSAILRANSSIYCSSTPSYAPPYVSFASLPLQNTTPTSFSFSLSSQASPVSTTNQSIPTSSVQVCDSTSDPRVDTKKFNLTSIIPTVSDASKSTGTNLKCSNSVSYSTSDVASKSAHTSTSINAFSLGMNAQCSEISKSVCTSLPSISKPSNEVQNSSLNSLSTTESSKEKSIFPLINKHFPSISVAHSSSKCSVVDSSEVSGGVSSIAEQLNNKTNSETNTFNEPHLSNVNSTKTLVTKPVIEQKHPPCITSLSEPTDYTVLAEASTGTKNAILPGATFLYPSMKSLSSAGFFVPGAGDQTASGNKCKFSTAQTLEASSNKNVLLTVKSALHQPQCLEKEHQNPPPSTASTEHKIATSLSTKNVNETSINKQTVNFDDTSLNNTKKIIEHMDANKEQPNTSITSHLCNSAPCTTLPKSSTNSPHLCSDLVGRSTPYLPVLSAHAANMFLPNTDIANAQCSTICSSQYLLEAPQDYSSTHHHDTSRFPAINTNSSWFNVPPPVDVVTSSQNAVVPDTRKFYTDNSFKTSTLNSVTPTVSNVFSNVASMSNNNCPSNFQSSYSQWHGNYMQNHSQYSHVPLSSPYYHSEMTNVSTECHEQNMHNSVETSKHLNMNVCHKVDELPLTSVAVSSGVAINNYSMQVNDSNANTENSTLITNDSTICYGETPQGMNQKNNSSAEVLLNSNNISNCPTGHKTNITSINSTIRSAVHNIPKSSSMTSNSHLHSTSINSTNLDQAICASTSRNSLENPTVSSNSTIVSKLPSNHSTFRSSNQSETRNPQLSVGSASQGSGCSTSTASNSCQVTADYTNVSTNAKSKSVCIDNVSVSQLLDSSVDQQCHVQQQTQHQQQCLPNNSLKLQQHLVLTQASDIAVPVKPDGQLQPKLNTSQLLCHQDSQQLQHPQQAHVIPNNANQSNVPQKIQIIPCSSSQQMHQTPAPQQSHLIHHQQQQRLALIPMHQHQHVVEKQHHQQQKQDQSILQDPSMEQQVSGPIVQQQPQQAQSMQQQQQQSHQIQQQQQQQQQLQHQQQITNQYAHNFDYSGSIYNRRNSSVGRTGDARQCYTSPSYSGSGNKQLQQPQQYPLEESTPIADLSGVGNFLIEDGTEEREPLSDHVRYFSVTHLVSQSSPRKQNMQNIKSDEKKVDKSKQVAGRKTETKSRAKASPVADNRRRSPARSSQQTIMWNSNKQGMNSQQKAHNYTAEALLSSQNYMRPGPTQPINQNYPIMSAQNVYQYPQVKNFPQNSFGYSSTNNSSGDPCAPDYNFQLHQTAGSLGYGSGNMPYMGHAYPYQASSSTGMLSTDFMGTSHHPPPPPPYPRFHDFSDQNSFSHNPSFPFAFDAQEMCPSNTGNPQYPMLDNSSLLPGSSGRASCVPFTPLRMMDRQQPGNMMPAAHLSSSLSNFNLTSIIPEIDKVS